MVSGGARNNSSLVPKAENILQPGAGGIKGGQGGEQQRGQKVMADVVLCPFAAISFGEQQSLQHAIYVPAASRMKKMDSHVWWHQYREQEMVDRYWLHSVHNNLLVFLR